MNNIKVLAYLCSAALLAACSQPEPVMEVSAEPVYNKMGEVVGCTDGRTFIPGTAPQIDPCAPPPPPMRQHESDNDDSDSDNRNPTGGR